MQKSLTDVSSLLKPKAIFYDGHILLKNVSAENIREIKDSLTFENPAYVSAKKYSKWNNVSIPAKLYYYEKFGKDLIVPVGTDLSAIENLSYSGQRVCEKIAYPDFIFDLREDQKIAAQKYVAENMDSRYLNGCIQMPTGKGKTILGLYLAQHLSCKTLVLVHKDDLVKAWNEDIKQAFAGKLIPGLIKAQSRKLGEQITIATVQTLNRLSSQELEQLVNKFGFIIQDEMHHCVLGNTLVVKKDGGVIPIAEIKEKTKVLGGTVTNPFNIESAVYRLSFEHGIIEGSEDHPTFCLDKRKYFDAHVGQCVFDKAQYEIKSINELDNNFVVPILIKLPHTTTNSITPVEAAFAAGIMCDGHVCKEGNGVKTNVSSDFKFYTSLFRNYLLDNFVRKIDNRGNLLLKSHDSQLKEHLMTMWGIPEGKKSSNITIPSFLYYSSLETIKAFIETCFSCEGDLSCTNDNWRINFVSCSKEFVLGLSLLLRKFGILAKFQVISKKPHSDVYRLTCGGKMFNLFMDTFSLIPRKKTSKRNNGTVNSNRFFGDYYLSDVKHCQPLGYTDTVYDFTVPETSSFIANGLHTHNCPANSFLIASRFNARYKLGLTATPERSDGLDEVMNLFYGGFCSVYEDRGKKEEDILPVKIRAVELTQVYFDPVCTLDKFSGKFSLKKPFEKYPENFILGKTKDYRLSVVPYNYRPKISFFELDDIVVKRAYPYIISKIYKVYTYHKSILVFFSQKEHCRLYKEYLVDIWKVPEEDIGLYYGDNSAEENNRVLEKAESQRSFITLATYSKATEGTNVTRWEVAFFVSSMNNEKIVEQAVGRTRRTRKDGDKMKRVIVYDYRFPNVYGFNRHGSTRDARYKKLNFLIRRDSDLD